MDDTPATVQEAADGQDVIQLERPESFDVMFVIDRSWSMGDDYEALAANIRSFVPALEGLLNEKQVDCRLGLLCYDVSMRWPWLDLTAGVSAFTEKLLAIKPGRRNECTPQAMDFAVEHASWRDGRRGYLAVMTDEAAENGGLPCTEAQFRMLLSKIGRRRLGLHFVTTPWALGTGSQQRLYGLIPDYANTFVSGSLREDRGEKLVRWLAGSISTHKHTEPPLAAGLISHDIFGVFTLVTLL